MHWQPCERRWKMDKKILKEYEDSFDFGFTIEDDLEEKLDNLHGQYLDEVSSLKADIQNLEKLIMPLLVNLMKNPDKPTIKWPNRKEQIEQQVEKILAITRKK